MKDDINIKDLINIIQNNKSILENSDDGNNINYSKYNDILGKVKSDLNLNLGFILEFGTSITAFFPIVQQFIQTGGMVVEDMESTVVYLTICALSIAFRLPKSEYKNLFQELRLRGVYGKLKPLIALINVIYKLFKFISNKVGVITLKLIDMFAYTALFVPFILTLSNIISGGFTLENLIKSVSTNAIGKILSVTIGGSMVTIKHLIDLQLKKLSNFNPLDIESISKIIGKFKDLESKKSMVSDDDDDDIVMNFDQFKSENEIINENRYIEIEKEYGSIGEYVEYLKGELDETDEVEFKRIIGDYVKDDTNLDVRLANSINNLKKFDQRRLLKYIEDGTLSDINESVSIDNIDIDIDSGDTITDDVVEDVKLGKGAFNSFLKVLNAMSFEDIKPNREECPEDFTIIYTFKEVENVVLSGVIKRFRSLNKITELLTTLDNDVCVYFGIKSIKNAFFVEYGIMDDDKRLNVGEFKITQSTYKKLMSNESKCLVSLQEELTGLDIKDLKTLMDIKRDLVTFEPGFHFEKSNCIIKDNILSIGFYGLGQWEAGKIDKNNLKLLKSEFKKWVLSKKWKELVQFNILPDKFWVKFNLKVK